MGSRLSHLPGRARFFSHPGPDEIPCTQRRHAHDLQYMPDGGFVLFHLALSGDSRLDQVGTAVKRQQAPMLMEQTPRDLEWEEAMSICQLWTVNGAQGGTRTPMVLGPSAPQAGAS